MDKDLKDKWLAALRSGQYKQGSSYLRTLDDKYCCLGVLCEVIGIPAEKSYVSNKAYGYDAEVSGLSPQVQELTGLTVLGKLPKDAKAPQNSLAVLNDKGYSFEAIADIIEEYV